MSGLVFLSGIVKTKPKYICKSLQVLSWNNPGLLIISRALTIIQLIGALPRVLDYGQ